MICSPSPVRVQLVQTSAFVQDIANLCEINVDFVRIAVNYDDLTVGYVQEATAPEFSNVPAIGVLSKRGNNFREKMPILHPTILKWLLTGDTARFWAVFGILKVLVGHVGRQH